MSDLRELLHAAAPRPRELDLGAIAERSEGAGRRNGLRSFVAGLAVVAVIGAIAALALYRDDGKSAPAARPATSVPCDFGNAEHTSVTLSRTPTNLVMAWHSLPPISPGHRTNAAGIMIGHGQYIIDLIWHDDGTSSGVLWDYSTSGPRSGTRTNVAHRFGHGIGRVTVPLGRMRKLPRTFSWSASTGIADLGNLVSCPAAGQLSRFPLTSHG